MMQFDWVDLAIVGIIVLSVLTGLIRGFVKEIIAICIWIIGLTLAYNYSSLVDVHLQHYIEDTTLRKICSFMLILIAVIIIGGILNALLSFILKRSGLSGTDRMLGMLFGLIRGIFIVALIIMGVKMTSLPHQDYIRSSQLYARFIPLAGWLEDLMPEFIKKMKVSDKNKYMDFSATAEDN